MSKNFKNSIKSNITTNTDSNSNNNNNKVITTTNTDSNSNNDTKTFILKKKTDDKKDKSVFNVYIDPLKLKNLDTMCKKSRYSRNELVNMMIDYCVNNWKIEDDK